MAFTNFAIDRKSKEYFWSMAYRPLLIVCWYQPAGVYEFFKQPLLLISLTTSPYWFWRVNDVCQTLEVCISEKLERSLWWKKLDETLVSWFMYLVVSFQSNPVIKLYCMLCTKVYATMVFLQSQALDTTASDAVTAFFLQCW